MAYIVNGGPGRRQVCGKPASWGRENVPGDLIRIEKTTQDEMKTNSGEIGPRKRNRG